MYTDPKPAFSRQKFMLTAALSCAIFLIANVGAQTGLNAWKDTQPQDCFIVCDYFFVWLGVELAIILANVLVLGTALVRSLRKRGAGALGTLTGFGGFILAVGAYFAIGHIYQPMTAVPLPPVSPIPPGGGQGQIAFMSSSGDLVLMGADGNSYTILEPGPVDSLAWSPDGGQLAFAGNCDKKTCLYILTAEGGLTRFTDNNSITDEDPIWAPDGAKIAFVSDSSYMNVMNADGSHRIQLGSGSSPAWSPDGKRLAFVRNEDAHIYLVNADGSGLTALKNTSASSINRPAWSPDGRQMAFTGGSTGLYVVNADGSGLRQLSAVYSGEPAWSPDGKHILSDGGQGIYLRNADGSGEVILTDRTKNISKGVNPSWSPDGSQIAFMAPPNSVFGNYPEVCVMNADGSGDACFTHAVADYFSFDRVYPNARLAWRP